MVLVHESPSKSGRSEQEIARWPPRSPFHALMSSPSGRKRWQDSRRSPPSRSPSPSPRRSRTSESTNKVAVKRLDCSEPKRTASDYEGDEDHDDEETLQLRLQAIEAKLRLKRLQKAKCMNGDSQKQRISHNNQRSESIPRDATESGKSRKIEVPLSPIQNEVQTVEKIASPSRVRLGLPAALPEDVSLKRARRSVHIPPVKAKIRDGGGSKTLSFSERLAETRREAEKRLTKTSRLESIRKTAFSDSILQVPKTADQPPNVGHTSVASGEGPGAITGPLSLIEKPLQGLVDSRGFVDKAELRPTKSYSHHMTRPSSTRPCQASQRPEESRKVNADGRESGSTQGHSPSDVAYDTFSDTHLSKRHLSHSALAREMEGKAIYTLPRLLKEVKSPLYEPPDCDSDFVVFAILASKSDPYQHASAHRTTDPIDPLASSRNKFLVLHLCDLQWEVDCFIFGTAFNQFWKLTPGTLLAILNPAIMPPKTNIANGRFSLKLGSSEDSVLEIGTARDLGYCVSVKKDGKQCAQWIDKRRTEVCEFHLNLLVDRSRKDRMEVNTMWRGTEKSKNVVNKNTSTSSGSYTREHGQLYSVAGASGLSAATILDTELSGTSHPRASEEASRKRILAAQKERDLARKLSEMGRSVGAAYLRVKDSTTSDVISSKQRVPTVEQKQLFPKPSASDLGLLANNASHTRLSPSKDRKPHFSISTSSSRQTTAVGWANARKVQPPYSEEGIRAPGSANKKSKRSGQVRPRSQDSNTNGTFSSSPLKKKARFDLEMGIREPGMDSLHGIGDQYVVAQRDEKVVLGDNDDDYDDELDII